MAERSTVPNLEAKATDGNPVFTPKQWLERFRQFCKREHKIDIAPLLKGEEITETNWTGKEQAVQEDFIWGVGSEALYQITRAEYKTEPDSIKIKDLIRLPLTTLTTTEEIFSGRSRPKMKHPKNSGDG